MPIRLTARSLELKTFPFSQLLCSLTKERRNVRSEFRIAARKKYVVDVRREKPVFFGLLPFAFRRRRVTGFSSAYRSWRPRALDPTFSSTQRCVRIPLACRSKDRHSAGAARRSRRL